MGKMGIAIGFIQDPLSWALMAQESLITSTSVKNTCIYKFHNCECTVYSMKKKVNCILHTFFQANHLSCLEIILS